MKIKILIAILGLFCLSLVSTPAQELFMNQGDPLPPELEDVYLKGLAYLMKSQDKDGSWGDAVYGGGARQPAVAALSVLAMLAHGDDPNSGPYAAAIKHGLNFVLSQQDARTGYIGSTMYNHGFSTLALAEAYGAVQDDRLGPALEKAVALSLSSQSRNPEKAWRYSPDSNDADTTVSGAIFVSLAAARNAGIAVPEEAFKNALAFYKKCALPGGGFGYTGRDAPSGPRTAIGVLVFALARQKNDSAYKEGVKLLIHPNDEAGGGMNYPFYYEYYASQAFFQSDVKAWEEWNRRNLKRLAASQTPEGGWEGQNGPAFCTAAALLSLALNYRFLPIYER